MTQERYFAWMRIWEWFARFRSREQFGSLYEMLNTLWQEERDDTPPEDLAKFAGVWSLEHLDFAIDAEYQAFVREMEKGEKEPE